jgi:hypothetical protein
MLNAYHLKRNCRREEFSTSGNFALRAFGASETSAGVPKDVSCVHSFHLYFSSF